MCSWESRGTLKMVWRAYKQTHVFWCTLFTVLDPHYGSNFWGASLAFQGMLLPSLLPQSMTRTPGGLAGGEKHFCSHRMSTLTYDLLKALSMPGSPGPLTSSAVLVISSVMPSGIGLAVLLPTWGLLQGPTGSCTEGASGTRRAAPDTGLSIKGHIQLSARRASGKHQEETHALDFTQVKEISLQFSFLLKKKTLTFILHPPSDSETWFKNKTKHIHHIS